MKLTEVEAKTIRCVLAVRYDEEDIPKDFPFRKGDTWTVDIDIETGKIAGWPAGRAEEVYMKVCDEGSYYLYAADGSEIAKKEGDYVPSCIPGEYGDYIDFDISKSGVIKKWKEFCDPDSILEAFDLGVDE